MDDMKHGGRHSLKFIRAMLIHGREILFTHLRSRGLKQKFVLTRVLAPSYDARMHLGICFNLGLDISDSFDPPPTLQSFCFAR